MSEADKPKIVVDSDWKSQARAEKERLAATEKNKAPAPAAGGQGKAGAAGAGGAGERHGQERMPEADFSTLVGTLITQALMYMGGIPDPETGRAMVSLEHARFHIDLLGVLEAKTKGNLTEDEAQDVSQSLNELRLRFVEISKAVAQWQAQQAMGGGAGGMGGLGGAGGADANPLSFSEALRKQQP